VRNGAVKIKFVAGEIKEACTSPGLNAFYKRMFEAAKTKAKSAPSDVENGIQVIVFGTFLVEAHCNDSYREFISTVIPEGELADAIWNAAKRLAILEKVNVATAVNPVSKTGADIQARRLKLLSDLRNRLAHFKDSDTVWDAPIEFISKPENWSQAPEPELTGHLTGQKLSDYISDVDHLLTWFDKVFGIKRTAMELSADLK
jgi:hypothetical protein